MWGFTERGSWRPNRNCNILTSTLMAVNVVSFWGPLCWVMAFFTASCQQLFWSPNSIGFPRAPSAGCGFTYHNSSISVSNSTATGNSNSTELYNSSTLTRSPTRSLKSHVWSSSSENNCHVVHRSLSSGASVYECTMGIFLACPISSANFRPRDFLL